MITDEQKQSHDYICGKHSGFPECCIDFFINNRLNPNRDPDEAALYAKLSRQLDSDPEFRQTGGYVVCPDCIQKRNFVKVKNCTCGADIGRALDPDEVMVRGSSGTADGTQLGGVKIVFKNKVSPETIVSVHYYFKKDSNK